MTAVPGEDYEEATGTLAFAEGESLKVLTLPILWNHASELDTQFRLILSNPSPGAVLSGNTTATIAIIDATGMAAHRFEGMMSLTDGKVHLGLGGGVSRRLAPFFDFYPIEVSDNSSFRVAVWYPATPQAGSQLLPYSDEVLLRDESWWPGWTDRTRYFKDYAFGGLEVSDDQVSWPVVLLSHGHTGARDDLVEKANELASHGYVVVAPDHPDATAIVFPDGTYELRDKGIHYTSEAGLRDRARDLGFILDELERWAANHPLFAGRLDLARVAAMGFSWGGATALEFCRIDMRCRGAVALDPGGFATPELPAVGLQKPSLTINGSSNSYRAVFDKSGQDSIWFQISNTTHGDIGGFGWWASGTAQAVLNGCQINRTANAFTLWFLNKHLNSSPDPMPALADHPRVGNLTQK